MKMATKITLLVLVLIVGGIVFSLVRETSAGPSFRPGDYETLEECLGAIPAAWLEGSVEQIGAETACRHLHGR